MSKELEIKIREVIMTIQDVMDGHSKMAKSRITNVAVRRIMDIINEDMKGTFHGKEYITSDE
jgi:hypothetical protein